MRFMIALSAAGLLLAGVSAQAQDAPSEAPAKTEADAPKPKQKLTIDTPLEEIVAVPAGKEIIEKRLPGLMTHPMWETLKAMTLPELVPLTSGKIPPDRIALVEADLAALKD